MKAIVATYETDEMAVKAIQHLSEFNFPLNKVSLIGKSEIHEDNLHVKSNNNIKNAPAIIGVGAGTIIGLLSGIGVFAIPGFGFLYGSGAVIGAIGGLDLGVLGGGLTSLLISIGLKKEETVQFEKHLNNGRFLVIVNGSEREINLAETLLHGHGKHVEISK
ncbi:MAG: hypothetical protein R2799_05300 [Crocinitomicaceae bacterium]